MCRHIDYPCCGCGSDLEQYDDAEICGRCETPMPYCLCNDYDAEPDPGWADGDHETGLASAGWGMDEDYLPGFCEEW